MSMELRQWIVAFRNAILASQPEPSMSGDNQTDAVWAEPCSRHGSRCVWVLYRSRVAACAWATTAPAAQARALSHTRRLAF